jgi:hypothetical protein
MKELFTVLEVYTSQIRDFQKAAVDKVEFRQRLKSYGDQPVQEVLDLVKSWEKLWSEALCRLLQGFFEV